jgi:hypothetical protein
MAQKKKFGTRVKVQRKNGKFVKCKAEPLPCMEMQSIMVETASHVRNIFVGKKPTQKFMHPRTCKTMAEFAAMYDYDKTRCAVCGNVENCEFEETSNHIFVVPAFSLYTQQRSGGELTWRPLTLLSRKVPFYRKIPRSHVKVCLTF